MDNFKKIFKQVAKNNGISKSEVENDISLAILGAMENPEKSDEAEFFWQEFLKTEAAPTPKNVIAEIAKKVILSLTPPPR